MPRPLAAEDLESMEAILELLSDPDAQARIAGAERDIERGDVLTESELHDLDVDHRRDKYRVE